MWNFLGRLSYREEQAAPRNTSKGHCRVGHSAVLDASGLRDFTPQDGV
ncbi:hypothetical protein SH668x_003012 [Planctomicrobium sp. SH668]